MTRRTSLRSTLALASLVAFANCAPPSGGGGGGGAPVAITLAVDAREAPRKILHSHETIPVKAGALTLLYPKWIPGEHGPTGPLTDVAGIRITGGGKTIPWRRDLEEMFAIHCDIPAGVTSIDVAFDFILPPQASGFSSGASASGNLLVLSWNQVVMYPSRPRPDDITVTPSVQLPTGWQFATALTKKTSADGKTDFEPTSLTMLVDSPVQAGQHVKRIDLSSAPAVPTFLNLVADADADLAVTPAELDGFKGLVREENALFGAHHYAHYDFLFTLSDQVAHFGLEHHQSSDDRVGAKTLIDQNLWKVSADLLPHEFTHSWNGKFRRPAGLATGDYSTPMKGDLLWVYEGLTQYIGKIIAARSGLRTPEEYREDQALLAARLENRPGRTWRPLQDVNDEAQLLYYARGDWDSWRRAVDFYDEGDLIWLDADVTIRKLTNGAKSLDDFCKAFHGGPGGKAELKPYTLDDVVMTLNSIAANDWKSFFVTRVQNIAPHAPLGGVEGSGWKLAYSEIPSPMQSALDAVSSTVDARYSLGLYVANDGTVIDVFPGWPADKAGLAPGMTITNVNGGKFSGALLREAIRQSKTSKSPIQMLATNASEHGTYAVDYHGPERYPVLERDSTKADVLAKIIASRSTR